MAKTKPPKRRTAVAHVPAASRDLRNVPRLVERLVGGEEEAQTILMGMGRHAAHLVAQEAEARDDERLRQLGRRLAAIPPQADTNLFELRQAAVRALAKERGGDAPALFQAEPFQVGAEVALFDPAVLAADIAGSGRPRRQPDRLGKGDLAWFSLPREGLVMEVRPAPPPSDQATLRLRLKVKSGVVAVGAPEASDGHRLGSVRLDPHSTDLHARAHRCRWFALTPGVYAVHAWRNADTIRLRLVPEPQPKPHIEVSLGALRVPEVG